MIRKFIIACFSIGLIGAILGVGLVVWAIFFYGKDIPDYKELKNYEPPIVTRVYGGGGNLMAEFATEKRVFVPYDAIPKEVIEAFVSAEDQHFYIHPGLDFIGIARAVITNVQNAGKGRRLVGASTITQQVAKNFFLSNEVSYERKIKEAILALRIEQTFTKEQILELYLNEIYLGKSAYGVAAASLEYFDKSLTELNLDEIAYLAALPKAPNNYHPVNKREAAIARRNYVIDRMHDDKKITKAEAEAAKEKPLVTVSRDESTLISAPYFAEEVRRELAKLYGEDSLYTGGLIVHSSVDTQLQEIAEKALHDGLIRYDRRHGLHMKPLSELETLDNWQEQLKKSPTPAGIGDWRKAVVLSSSSKTAEIGFTNGEKAVITHDKMKWAAERISDFAVGAAPKTVSSVLKPGHVILVESANEKTKSGKDIYHFRQIPEVQGGIIALDPHTGRVLAMVGGFSQARSEFNRVTQARRQPGSAFKPIVYLTALENEFTPATLVLDAPFVLDQGAGLGKWRPQNYSGEFYGPTPLRIGIEKSRNLMTVRLANYIGMDKVAEMTQRLGINDNLPQVLSMSIGAGETTLLKMASAYATLVNGGKQVTPTFIDRIQNRDGETIFKHDKRDCSEKCGPLVDWKEQEPPEIPDIRPQIIDEKHAYQIVSIMEGVVQRGTGAKLRSIGHPLAGKTGTTNDSKDTWFIGFSPDLVVGVYVGFDNPRPMGKKETGSRVAVPIVKDFFEAALADKPPIPFRAPNGIRRVRIDATDGTRAAPGDEKTILETFIAGTEPGDEPIIFDGEQIRILRESESAAGEGVDVGTGGIY